MECSFYLNMCHQPCPIPVVSVKRWLDGQIGVCNYKKLIVMVDDLIAVENVEKLITVRNKTMTYQKKNDCYEIVIKL